ncbi:MAG: hypothetical protein GKS07_10945 [Nitrosopumilus sp.]|nr:MAG: hypothetical protein GKS07_00510 [Nitrosopumilus sp.]QMU55358.1 MAG: hypothetical protein GKS07_10945 [Nitrosopumilus sp.]
MSAIIGLGIGLTALALFVSKGGFGEVSAFVGDRLGNGSVINEDDDNEQVPETEKEEIDDTPIPIDGGPILPPVQGPQLPQREITPQRLPEPEIEVLAPNLTQFVEPSRSIPRPVPNVSTPKVRTTIKTTKTFRGGGPGFVGGSVNETPVTKNSSLGFIIKKLGVSASKAASLRRSLRGGIKLSDLGTNTGSGQKIPTTNRAGQRSGEITTSNRKRTRKEALEEAAEKARLSFDSRSITNFRN